MLSALHSQKIRLHELKNIRESLWKRFEGNPNEIHLAAKLKIIDDQIAQFNLQRAHDGNKIDNSKLAAVPKA